MDIKEAVKIVSSYGNSIAKIKQGDVVQPLSDLEYQPGTIKLALLLYTDFLLKKRRMDRAKKEDFELAYSIINSRFREEAEEINQVFKKIFAEGNNNLIKDIELFKEKYDIKVGTRPGGPDLNAEIEFNNFLVERRDSYL